MPSWRDTTPQPIQDDLDGLVSTSLDAAHSLLTKNGEFFPFGMTVSNDGEVALAAADGLGEQPASTDVLDALLAGLRSHVSSYRAAALVSDVRANGGDAVRVEAEHRDGGPAIVILMPYAKKGLVRKAVTFGQIAAGAGERRVWPMT